MYRIFMKFSYILVCVPLILCAESSNQSEELEAINARIANLRTMLQKDAITKQNEEVESQNYMIADWPKYSEEVQDIRKKELYEQKILQEIQTLEDRKKQLLQNNTLPRSAY